MSDHCPSGWELLSFHDQTRVCIPVGAPTTQWEEFHTHAALSSPPPPTDTSPMIVSGAGDASYNGTYTYDGYNVADNVPKPKYRNGHKTLFFFNGGAWVIWDEDKSAQQGPDAYYGTGNGARYYPSGAAWNAVNGRSPAPRVDQGTGGQIIDLPNTLRVSADAPVVGNAGQVIQQQQQPVPAPPAVQQTPPVVYNPPDPKPYTPPAAIPTLTLPSPPISLPPVVLPVPTGNKPAAAPATGQIIHGVPNWALFAGAGGALLLFIMAEK